MRELIFAIDGEKGDQGLRNARRLAQYDTGFDLWRMPIEVPEETTALVERDFLVSTLSASGLEGDADECVSHDALWNHAAAICIKHGWLINTTIDPANRPANWASPQFPTADLADRLPTAAR